jgi:hypothetical protein
MQVYMQAYILIKLVAKLDNLEGIKAELGKGI